MVCFNIFFRIPTHLNIDFFDQYRFSATVCRQQAESASTWPTGWLTTSRLLSWSKPIRTGSTFGPTGCCYQEFVSENGKIWNPTWTSGSFGAPKRASRTRPPTRPTTRRPIDLPDGPLAASVEFMGHWSIGAPKCSLRVVKIDFFLD